jgi:hypothetical protein
MLIKQMKPDVVVHTVISALACTWEAEAGGSRVQDYHELHNKTLSKKQKSKEMGWGRK